MNFHTITKRNFKEVIAIFMEVKPHVNSIFNYDTNISKKCQKSII